MAHDDPLSSIKVLYRQSDTLTLWGIPYDMRPGQQPGDLFRAARNYQPLPYGWYGSPRPTATDNWIYLGTCGWYGTLSKERIEEIKVFLETHKDLIPQYPEEWSKL